MTDQERLDWLEWYLTHPEADRTVVVLSSWWSGMLGNKPDGYSVNIGELETAAEEFPSLRAAIDAAIEDCSLQKPRLEVIP